MRIEEKFVYFIDSQYISVAKHKYTPSMRIDRKIVSELKNFFTESGCGLGIQRLMNVLGMINITERQIAYEKKTNSKFTCSQVIQMIQMMILFPFFSTDFDELMKKIISQNKQLGALMKVIQQLPAAA